MPADTLNICQVSLARDIPIIIENYKRFKKIYRKIRIFIICPKSQIKQFKTHLKIKDIKIINEEKIISIKKFKNLFEKLSSKTKYKKKIEERINWYYQQILKISFIIQFIKINKENIIIWDADTIILKKFNFFKSNKSVLYGTFFEFHKPYYLTNKRILKKQPDYFISFLNQFIAITVKEGIFLSNILLKKKIIL
jgi:hypothetical protein